MPKLRSNLGQRGQNKPPLRQCRMRQRQFLLPDDLLPHHQQIQIQGPRAFGLSVAAIAPHLDLNRQQPSQKRHWLQFCLQGNHCVQESGLIAVANRIRLID